MKDDKDVFDKLNEGFFAKHPGFRALIPLVLGVVCILAAIYNWDWLLSPQGTFRGLGGVSAILGRGAARIVCVIVGLVFFYVAYLMFKFPW